MLRLPFLRITLLLLKVIIAQLTNEHTKTAWIELQSKTSKLETHWFVPFWFLIPWFWVSFYWFGASVIGVMELGFLGMEFSRLIYITWFLLNFLVITYIFVNSYLFWIEPENSCSSTKTVFNPGFVMHTRKMPKIRFHFFDNQYQVWRWVFKSYLSAFPKWTTPNIGPSFVFYKFLFIYLAYEPFWYFYRAASIGAATTAKLYQLSKVACCKLLECWLKICWYQFDTCTHKLPSTGFSKNDYGFSTSITMSIQPCTSRAVNDNLITSIWYIFKKRARPICKK